MGGTPSGDLGSVDLGVDLAANLVRVSRDEEATRLPALTIAGDAAPHSAAFDRPEPELLSRELQMLRAQTVTRCFVSLAVWALVLPLERLHEKCGHRQPPHNSIENVLVPY
jgi:hypothetical protein